MGFPFDCNTRYVKHWVLVDKPGLLVAPPSEDDDWERSGATVATIGCALLERKQALPVTFLPVVARNFSGWKTPQFFFVSLR